MPIYSLPLSVAEYINVWLNNLMCGHFLSDKCQWTHFSLYKYVCWMLRHPVLATISIHPHTKVVMQCFQIIEIYLRSHKIPKHTIDVCSAKWSMGEQTALSD